MIVVRRAPPPAVLAPVRMSVPRPALVRSAAEVSGELMVAVRTGVAATEDGLTTWMTYSPEDPAVMPSSKPPSVTAWAVEAVAAEFRVNIRAPLLRPRIAPVPTPETVTAEAAVLLLWMMRELAVSAATDARSAVRDSRTL